MNNKNKTPIRRPGDRPRARRGSFLHTPTHSGIRAFCYCSRCVVYRSLPVDCSQNIFVKTRNPGRRFGGGRAAAAAAAKRVINCYCTIEGGEGEFLGRKRVQPPWRLRRRDCCRKDVSKLITSGRGMVRLFLFRGNKRGKKQP